MYYYVIVYDCTSKCLIFMSGYEEENLARNMDDKIFGRSRASPRFVVDLFVPPNQYINALA
jgi:hypothetical protein